MDKPYIIIPIFLLWMGLYIGLPHLFFSGHYIGICAIIGLSVTYAAIPFIESQASQPLKSFPICIGHFWGFIGYIVSAMIVIAYKDLSYVEIRNLAKSCAIIAAYPIVTFIIDCLIKK